MIFDKLKYVLVLVLCICCFNGNVYAEEGEAAGVLPGLGSSAIADFTVSYDVGKFYGTSCTDLEGSSDKWLKSLSNYQLRCLYGHDVGSNGCHVIQLSFSKNGDISVDENYPVLEKFTATYKATFTNSDVIEDIEQSYAGSCPVAIYINLGTGTDMYIDDGGNVVGSGNISRSISLSKGSGSSLTEYPRIGADGTNLVTDQKASDDIEIPLTFEKFEITSCEQLLGDSDELINMIKTVINVTKILIPVLLIGLGIVDFVQAVFAGNEDKMKKAQSRFIKRLIIGVIIFLIPSVLKALLTIANSIWPNIDADLCGLFEELK